MLRTPTSVPPAPITAGAISDPRLTRIAEDVASRLRPACGAMPAEDFAGLVHDIAVRKLRWADR